VDPELVQEVQLVVDDVVGRREVERHREVHELSHKRSTTWNNFIEDLVQPSFLYQKQIDDENISS
jgi:hypothetical protein